MPRPCRARRVCSEPCCRAFGPERPAKPSETGGAGKGEADVVNLLVEEFEVIRIVDFEKRTHEQCATQMGVSRTTVTEIYERARFKLADAIVNAKRLVIEGGSYEICGGACAKHCAGRCPWKYKALAESVEANFKVKGSVIMKIAIPVKNENIFQHFGMAPAFKVYTVENRTIVGTEMIEAAGQGHGAKVAPLVANHVDCVVCGGIGDGAASALAAAGIQLIAGINGNADEAAAACVAETLESCPEAAAAVSRHAHRHAHGCGCGGHGHEGHGECGCGCHEHEEKEACGCHGHEEGCGGHGHDGECGCHGEGPCHGHGEEADHEGCGCHGHGRGGHCCRHHGE